MVDLDWLAGRSCPSPSFRPLSSQEGGKRLDICGTPLRQAQGRLSDSRQRGCTPRFSATCQGRLVAAPVAAREGEHGQVARPLYGEGERSLVLRADAGLAAGLYLRLVGEVTPYGGEVLVVDVLDLVDAEAADLSAGVVPGAPPPSSSGGGLPPPPPGRPEGRAALRTRRVAWTP